jgi:prepilin-type N-terminal cleavage/methylation domain-containing protein
MTMKTQSQRAFTLVEMLVVIAVVGILAGMLLPLLSRGKQRTLGTSCMNNGHQLVMALTMYANDNHDYFPPNPDDGNTIPGHNWVAGKAGQYGDQEFDPDILNNSELDLMLPYIGGNIAIFRCPSDKRMGPYQGADPLFVGKWVPAARTFSMSQAVGTICPGFNKNHEHEGVPTLPVNGPWLDGTHRHRADSPWMTYGSMNNLRAPGPSMLWMITDEDSTGLNDAAFAFEMASPKWIDLPGTYHDYGCGFAYADGHSETHRWKYRGTKVRKTTITNPDDKQDWLWMRERTSANIDGTMPAPLP